MIKINTNYYLIEINKYSNNTKFIYKSTDILSKWKLKTQKLKN